ncbi:unnamed protein product [Phytophthora fragariaefolia]|uniref:Unnamed protein product n=1 Tax=Phytophthora fragariaefolia TaxID=1490495 RepID=A0A9W6U652_9STRA|nr:unnamed protein product [Phytophthora fragariaefolia]
MEIATVVVGGAWEVAATTVTSTGNLFAEHKLVLLWLIAGALIWTITEPLRKIGTRATLEGSHFVLKWGLLARLCLHRYCKYVRGPAVRGQPFRARMWKIYEAILATPMVVLEVKKMNGEGLGRLIYKWLDALHEYWCVFLPESWRFAWLTWKKYCRGSRMEAKRAAARALLCGRAGWTVISLGIYFAFYGILFSYECLEWACRGFQGVFVLVVTASYALASKQGETLNDIVRTNYLLLLVDGSILVVGVVSRLWRWYEATVGERSPVSMAKEGYAAWCSALEEQEQADRLREAFWRMDGGGDAPRTPVRTRSGLEAERRALRAKREVARTVGSRRGRRRLVGEDVPSRDGGQRLGSGAVCRDPRVDDVRSPGEVLDEETDGEDWWLK